MNYVIFDDTTWENLLPLTFTRPVADIRIGILKISEKWEYFLNTRIAFITKDYLSTKFPLQLLQDNILINGSVLPNIQLIQEINSLKPGEQLKKGDLIIALRVNIEQYNDFINGDAKNFPARISATDFLKLNFPWDIFSQNDKAIREDFDLITKGRTSEKISSTNNIAGAENIFLEKGAMVEFATINATTGPVYIGKSAEIMEGSVIRGPLAMCESSTLKMGAKIYGATTLGPHCKVGGEVNNSVLFGYSSKAHDGFLGNSVLGEWCNLGADTNNSNLKNNYTEVRVWNYVKESFVKTGLQFCGLIMGDHSKSGINTMFNTGTVVGVSANIFGAGFPRNFLPSFSWGGAQGLITYSTSKAFEVAAEVFKRRDLLFNETEKQILISVFEMTSKYRNF